MEIVTVPLGDQYEHPAVDIGIVGGHSGLLWSAPTLRLAGFGAVTRIPIDRTAGAGGAAVAQRAIQGLGEQPPNSSPTSGAVAFASLPFDREAAGELLVPQSIVAEDETGQQWLTVLGGASAVAAAVETLAAIEAPDLPATTAATVRSAVDPDEWRDAIVAETRDRIRLGELDKAVLARELIVTPEKPLAVATVVARLLARHSTAIIFAVDGFVGASPELLVARHGQSVRAHPLAGTAPRHADDAADRVEAAELLASTKNQWEHRITIEWLLDELLPFCSYVDAEPEPTVVSLPNVHHLGTLVEGVLSAPPASVLELVAALHPTPAVGGQPQAKAIELIAEIERSERGRYAGPVGWVDAAGNGAFAVGIRSAEIGPTEVRLFAGVGVVGDSDPAAELAETNAKFQAMLPALLGDPPAC